MQHHYTVCMLAPKHAMKYEHIHTEEDKDTDQVQVSNFAIVKRSARKT